jgi:hypothetical protein
MKEDDVDMIAWETLYAVTQRVLVRLETTEQENEERRRDGDSRHRDKDAGSANGANVDKRLLEGRSRRRKPW